MITIEDCICAVVTATSVTYLVHRARKGWRKHSASVAFIARISDEDARLIYDNPPLAAMLEDIRDAAIELGGDAKAAESLMLDALRLWKKL